MAQHKKSDEQRIRALIRDIPKQHQDQARELASNIIAMEDKLAETREKIWGMDVVITYNNGGGQAGLRENPAYKAFSALLNQYLKTIRQLSDMRSTPEPPSMFDWNK